MSEGAEQGPSSRQDLIGGLLSVALGLSAFIEAAHYPIGSLLRMGPGFFPCGIAAIITLLGLMLIISSFRSRPVDRSAQVIRFRSVAAIGLGVALFALLIERAGLIPATLVLLVVSSFAQQRWDPRRIAYLSVAITALVYLIFIVVLQIPVAAVKL
ncbi:MAG TPA: tripartite tricarboxylate transporter TctB family protein [Bradyrhizobium sp.]|nr:tripartite tricarboxylate transporter TctB family protein [Bradyrhizobium sp.]